MMGYCRMLYEVYKADPGKWEEMVRQLLDECGGMQNIVRLIFFASPVDNKEYIGWKQYLSEEVKNRFSSPRPLISLVAQRPLDAGLVMEVHRLEPDFQGKLTEKCVDGVHYLKLEDRGYREVIAGGLCGEDPDAPVKEQSFQALSKAEKILQAEKMEWEDVVRQWNYLERITEFSDGNQRYQDFNDARSHFYASVGWRNGYPAATGIGAQFGGVLIDLNAVVAEEKHLHIVPLDNDLQVAAHVYSDHVLVSNEQKKTTPKFERAKVLSDGEHGVVYISGTAAIRGEDSLRNVGVLVQTGITMENIQHLIGEENLNKAGVVPVKPNEMKVLRVYLKNAEDVDAVKVYMEHVYTRIPVSYLLADVCRDELLVEIEGIAVF